MKLFCLMYAAFLVACTSCASYKKCKTTTVTDIVIVQNGIEKIVSDLEQTISLKKEGFSIRFYNKQYDPEDQKFYAARVVAFEKKDEVPNVVAGMRKNDIEALKPGTGMASDRSGKYEALIFRNTAHHYLYYSDSTSQRLDLVEQGDEYLNLEFSIEAAKIGDQTFDMGELPLSEFYLLVVIDRNLNGVINPGEFKLLTLKLG